MNLVKNKNGNFIILLTEGEVQQMKNVLLQGETISLFEEDKRPNPFKNLRSKTVAFIKELIDVYGAKGLITIDEKFQDIRFKHKIESYHSAFMKFEKEGFIKVIRDNNEQRKRIKALKLNF